MEIEVRPAGEQDLAALRSLSDWLAREPAVKTAARLEYGPGRGREGDMGPVLPEFIVVLSLAGQVVEAGKFVAAVAGWVKEHGHDVVVRNRRGREAAVGGDDAATVAEVAAVIAEDEAGDE